MVDPTLLSKEEARYYSDKMTLEDPKTKLSQDDLLKLTPVDLKILNVLPKNYKKLLESKNVSLKELHNFYKDNFHIEDTKRIDIVLAVALSQKLP